MGRSRRSSIAWLVTVLLAGGAAVPVAPGVAAGASPWTALPARAPGGGCERQPQPGQIIQQTPWHLKWLAPSRVWPFTNGGGVKVAVIDSGTEGTQMQLAGKVLPGFDMLRSGSTGDIDCIGHGTAVASIIAAKPQQGIGFQGLAPGVKILPVRVSEKEASGDKTKGDDVSPKVFGAAIRKAVDAGAKVINLSLTTYYPDPEIESAVKYAHDKDVVLVAAAGNQHRTDGKPDPFPFPAAYDGVIGVGAIDEQGGRVAESQVGPYVDLVAPGGAVIAATRLAGHNAFSGTSFATPMVAAAAALVRAAEPTLTADEVARRLIGTADPARGDASEGYGNGVLNLYRAVTERLTDQRPVAQPPLPEPKHDAAAEARAARWALLAQIALWVTAGAGVLGLAVAVAAFLIPKGRRRRWQPTRPAAPPPPAPDVDEPEEKFFQLPSTAARG